MWEGAVLFASREGRVIERLAPISPMRVVGGVGGPPSPTDPKDDKFPDVTDVFAEIVASIRTGYASRVAQAATCSAEANHAHNSNPVWQPLQTLAHRHGALGIAVSHNGPAIALLLPPDSPALPYQELTALGLDPVLDYVLS